jgi:hypothetical protein
MLSTKALLVFAVLVGIFADKCDLGNLGLQDFANGVRVTNQSDQADAFVRVTFNHGGRVIGLEAGKSATVYSFAATKYTITVSGQTDAGPTYYKQSLLDLREELVKAMTFDIGSSDLDKVTGELLTVQDALAQLDSSSTQTCSAKTADEGMNQASVKLATLSDGSKVWTLDCN